jgi:hypothetical protein
MVRAAAKPFRVKGTAIAEIFGNPTDRAMNHPDESFSAEEQETVQKLREAYIQDEGLPEELAEARARAEVNRLAGRTDDAFDAEAGTRDKRGGFQNDRNEPDPS